ncbi:hypothetical protein PP175_28300 (plasmid) [Aneurinibacillus sp. Ricciae_BoGa-3]|uniref:hypothetical protein n=1 Tax=Aneurinibacillus sp. Ricciae_BoGa-3 TaxID=3022697 RepID=UPI0023406B9C|nr:hypothetical protein [Aneurinibacillus sp. Ricciae_BoGa-3]WCK57093.1 hypothetical protein PP175_28300 [Aneurinibacillus sp. Ricciae_BoGa-3]
MTSYFIREIATLLFVPCFLSVGIYLHWKNPKNMLDTFRSRTANWKRGGYIAFFVCMLGLYIGVTQPERQLFYDIPNFINGKYEVVVGKPILYQQEPTHLAVFLVQNKKVRVATDTVDAGKTYKFEVLPHSGLVMNWVDEKG